MLDWLVVRASTGERFLCQTEDSIEVAIKEHQPIKIKNVYSLVTVQLMGQMGPSRITALEYPDLQDRCRLDSMHIIPAAWYVIPDEMAEKEIKDLEESMEKAAEFMKEMRMREESQITQARLAPMGSSPILGSLVKPPGLR